MSSGRQLAWPCEFRRSHPFWPNVLWYNIKRTLTTEPFLSAFSVFLLVFPFVARGLLLSLTRRCPHYTSCSALSILSTILSSSPLPSLGATVSVGVGTWGSPVPFCLRRLLKKSQEVTWANELNFSCPRLRKTKLVGRWKEVQCFLFFFVCVCLCFFFILAEKMARWKMWCSSLIRRQGRVSGLWVWRWETGRRRQTLPAFQTRVNTWSHGLTLSVPRPAHTHSHLT